MPFLLVLILQNKQGFFLWEKTLRLSINLVAIALSNWRIGLYLQVPHAFLQLLLRRVAGSLPPSTHQPLPSQLGWQQTHPKAHRQSRGGATQWGSRCAYLHSRAIPALRLPLPPAVPVLSRVPQVRTMERTFHGESIPHNSLRWGVGKQAPRWHQGSAAGPWPIPCPRTLGPPAG